MSFHEVQECNIGNYTWPELTFAQRVCRVRLTPTCLKQMEYDECPSAPQLLKVNDCMALRRSLNSRVMSHQRKKELTCTFKVSCGSDTGRSAPVQPGFMSLGDGQKSFFLVLGLTLGLLSFPSIPKQSVVIY